MRRAIVSTKEGISHPVDDASLVEAKKAAEKVLWLDIQGPTPGDLRLLLPSDGPDRFTPGYDFVAAGKAAMEAMVKYTAYRLRDEGVRINVLRSRAIRTASFDGTFGDEFYGFLRSFVDDGWFMTPEEVGAAALALCMGPFDGMTGQVLMADRGNTFCDGISYVYERREALGL